MTETTESGLRAEISRLIAAHQKQRRFADQNFKHWQDAEAKVARVEALADEWDRSSNPILHVAAGRVRAEIRKRS